MSIAALIVAALVGLAVGAVWYSPFLFGKVRARLAGVDMGQVGTLRLLLGPFICLGIVSYVLSMVLASMGAYSGWQGAEGGFWVWLGFVVPFTLMRVVSERRSLVLVTIDLTCILLVLGSMGAILAAW